MLRGAMNDGPADDPFLPLAVNLPDLDDAINMVDLEDSNMSDWLGRISPSAMTSGPDELLSVTDLLGLSGSGLLGAESDHELKSPEKFQDLRFTSTPKSKTSAAALDSGFGEESTANKSIEYKVVLNDITDKLKADFFTSLSDVCENSPNVKVSNQAHNDSISKTPLKRPPSADENKGDRRDQDKVWERNVSIIRRRIRTIPACRPTNILTRAASLPSAPASSAAVKDAKKPRKKKSAPQPIPVACTKCRGPLKETGETEISEGELLYYTGIKKVKHKSALGVVKFTRLPEFSKVTAFKRMLVTIMKLRFDFPYEDLGFRLREGTDLVRHIISSTAAVMGAALSPFIPWLEPLTARRAQKRVFYLHEITDSEMKVVVLLEDKSNLPICYVSEAYDPTFDGIHIATATVPQHFADSDLVCTLVADNPLFYRIVCTQTETSYKLAEGRFNEAAVESFLGRNQNCVKELSNYLATDIKRRTPTDVIPFDTAVKICSAFVNINHLPEENLLNYLQLVFTRSSQAVASHQPLSRSVIQN